MCGRLSARVRVRVRVRVTSSCTLISLLAWPKMWWYYHPALQYGICHLLIPIGWP